MPPWEGFSQNMDLEKTLEVPDDNAKAVWSYFQEETWHEIQVAVHGYLDINGITGNIAPMVKVISKETAAYEPYILIRASREAIKESGVVSLEQDVRAILITAGFADTRYHILLSGKRAPRPADLVLPEFVPNPRYKWLTQEEFDAIPTPTPKKIEVRIIKDFPGIPAILKPRSRVRGTSIVDDMGGGPNTPQSHSTHFGGGSATVAPNGSPLPKKKPMESSVKHLTCWYWLNNLGGCTKTEENCLYSHCNTVYYADQPRALRPGGRALAGKNLERSEAVLRNSGNAYLQNTTTVPFNTRDNRTGEIIHQGTITVPYLQGNKMPAYPYGAAHPVAPPVHDPRSSFPGAMYEPPSYNNAYPTGTQSFNHTYVPGPAGYNAAMAHANAFDTAAGGAVHQNIQHGLLPIGTMAGVYPGMNGPMNPYYGGVPNQGCPNGFGGYPPVYHGHPGYNTMGGGVGEYSDADYNANSGLAGHDVYGNRAQSNIHNGHGGSELYGTTVTYNNLNSGFANHAAHGNGVHSNINAGVVGSDGYGATVKTQSKPPGTRYGDTHHWLKPQASEFLASLGGNAATFNAVLKGGAINQAVPINGAIPHEYTTASTQVKTTSSLVTPSFSLNRIEQPDLAFDPPTDGVLIRTPATSLIPASIEHRGDHLPTPRVTDTQLKFFDVLATRLRDAGVTGPPGNTDRDLMTALLHQQLADAGLDTGNRKMPSTGPGNQVSNEDISGDQENHIANLMENMAIGGSSGLGDGLGKVVTGAIRVQQRPSSAAGGLAGEGVDDGNESDGGVKLPLSM